jgi:peptide/nickel transport system substrate-binding protein
MDRAALINDPDERDEAWADIDKMITAQAPAVPYNWDTPPTVWSSNVNAVISLNNSTIDLSFTSLK